MIGGLLIAFIEPLRFASVDLILARIKEMLSIGRPK